MITILYFHEKDAGLVGLLGKDTPTWLTADGAENFEQFLCLVACLWWRGGRQVPLASDTVGRRLETSVVHRETKNLRATGKW